MHLKYGLCRNCTIPTVNIDLLNIKVIAHFISGHITVFFSPMTVLSRHF